MTIQDCIDYVDSIEPNAYNNAQKAAWINECEGKVYTQLFLVQPYEYKTVSQSLALPAPYDRMYSRYLQAMIHYADGEYNRYQNSYAMFNEVWAEANRWFGGDFDVTDRLRNRRFESGVDAALGHQAIMTIPPGFAIAGARLVVGQEFTLSAASTARVWYREPDNAIGPPLDLSQRGSIPIPMIMGDRDGTELGVTLGPGAWMEAGMLYVTGRLLIPDEEWTYKKRDWLHEIQPRLIQPGGGTDFTKIPVTITIDTLSSLPWTVQDDRITANHVVFESELGTPGAQVGDWTVTTAAGSVTIDGVINGTTSLKLTLGISA